MQILFSVNKTKQLHKYLMLKPLLWLEICISLRSALIYGALWLYSCLEKAETSRADFTAAWCQRSDIESHHIWSLV